MNKKRTVFTLLYYPLILFIFISLGLIAAGIAKLIAATPGFSLRHISGILLLLFYFALPFLIAILMRFSLLKWYVDPFAAAIFPLFFFITMLVNTFKQTKSLSSALSLLCIELMDDGKMVLIMLIGYFVIGLLASFSIARTKGNSISYRLLTKIIKE